MLEQLFYDDGDAAEFPQHRRVPDDSGAEVEAFLDHAGYEVYFSSWCDHFDFGACACLLCGVVSYWGLYYRGMYVCMLLCSRMAWNGKKLTENGGLSFVSADAMISSREE